MHIAILALASMPSLADIITTDNRTQTPLLESSSNFEPPAIHPEEA